MGFRDRISSALSAARSATADIARAASGATRSAVLSAVGRAETAIQTAARAAGVARAAEPVRAQAPSPPPETKTERAAPTRETPAETRKGVGASPDRAAPPSRLQDGKDAKGEGADTKPAAPTKTAEAPPKGEPSPAPGGAKGGKVLDIGGGVVTSGSNARALSDYAAAAAAFADKLQRSNLNGATPFAVAVDAKGREVRIPADVFHAGPAAVADYLKEKIDAGKLGDKVNIRAKKFRTTENYVYEPPDDDADHYGETSK